MNSEQVNKAVGIHDVSCFLPRHLTLERWKYEIFARNATVNVMIRSSNIFLRYTTSIFKMEIFYIQDQSCLPVILRTGGRAKTSKNTERKLRRRRTERRIGKRNGRTEENGGECYGGECYWWECYGKVILGSVWRVYCRVNGARVSSRNRRNRVWLFVKMFLNTQVAQSLQKV